MGNFSLFSFCLKYSRNDAAAWTAQCPVFWRSSYVYSFLHFNVNLEILWCFKYLRCQHHNDVCFFFYIFSVLSAVENTSLVFSWK